MSEDRTGNPPPGAMSPAAFAALLATYGASPSRWPADRRAAAQALLAFSSEARAAHEGALALDKLLDDASVDPPAPALRDAILASAPRPAMAAPRAFRGSFWAELRASLGGWRPAAAALALSLLLGVVSGGALFADPADEIAVDIAELALFDDNFAGY